MAADGKGSRSMFSKHPSLSHTLDKMKLEIITVDEAIARKIGDEVATKYFDNFSGIIYLDEVEVLYAHTL
jgi:hypothetical protein